MQTGYAAGLGGNAFPVSTLHFFLNILVKKKGVGIF